MALTSASSVAFKLWLASLRYCILPKLRCITNEERVFGYQDLNSPIGRNITPDVQRLISSLTTIGAFVGSLLAGPMSIWLTRRQCIWVACLLCAVSNGIMMGTTNLGGISTGRLLIGIANGFYMVRRLDFRLLRIEHSRLLVKYISRR